MRWKRAAVGNDGTARLPFAGAVPGIRLTVAVLMLDIETEWTLNASLTTSSSCRKCSKRRTFDRSAQVTSPPPIEDMTRCSPIALGSGCGGILASAADPSLPNSDRAKLKADTPHCRESRATGRLAPSGLDLAAQFSSQYSIRSLSQQFLS